MAKKQPPAKRRNGVTAGRHPDDRIASGQPAAASDATPEDVSNGRLQAAQGAKPPGKAQRSTDLHIHRPRERLILLSKDEMFRDGVRQLLAACALPGRGSISFDKMTEDMNEAQVFAEVDKDNLENFANRQTKNVQNERVFCEYCRWLADQFRDKTPISKRSVVDWTLRNCLRRDVIGLIELALNPELSEEQFETEYGRIDNTHFGKSVHRNLQLSFQADPVQTRNFVENVIGGDGESRTARFCMYRYTGRKRGVYRSHYTFKATLDRPGTKENEAHGAPEPEMFINSFTAVGKGQKNYVRSWGNVIVQGDTAYLFGNLGGTGIHVVAIPKVSFSHRNAHELHGMALSVDLSSSIEFAPVAARVLLIRDDTDLDPKALTGALPEMEAVDAYFGGKASMLRHISNDVALVLKRPVRVKSRPTPIETYDNLINHFVADLRRAFARVELEGDDETESIILPRNLRGASALTMGPRDGG